MLQETWAECINRKKLTNIKYVCIIYAHIFYVKKSFGLKGEINMLFTSIRNFFSTDSAKGEETSLNSLEEIIDCCINRQSNGFTADVILSEVSAKVKGTIFDIERGGLQHLIMSRLEEFVTNKHLYYDATTQEYFFMK